MKHEDIDELIKIAREEGEEHFAQELEQTWAVSPTEHWGMIAKVIFLYMMDAKSEKVKGEIKKLFTEPKGDKS